MTMIGRVIDGLPLAASMQSDQDVCKPELFFSYKQADKQLLSLSPLSVN